MTRLILALAILAILLTSCAPVERQVAFIESEYIPFRGDGDSRIVGQAFLRTRGGEVKLAAGLAVVLTPVTSYSAEWFSHEVLRHGYLTPGDRREQAYIRVRTGDGEGRFKFTGIPAGRYYVTCEIHWELPDETYDGGTAYAVVDVGPGETQEIVVTRHP